MEVGRKEEEEEKGGGEKREEGGNSQGTVHWELKKRMRKRK